MTAKTLVGFAFALACAGAAAQAPEGRPFPPDAIKQGAGIYSQNCSTCHGPRMSDPQGAFDLRKFPLDEKNRFVNSVTKGKNAMPPWGDLLKANEIDALWAYVVAGEK
jgi:mono/diheme cytochrome c family protein